MVTKRSALWLLSLGVALGVARPAFADKVTLLDGRVLEGKVISRGDTETRIRLKFGVQSIPNEEIAKVEIVESPLEEFDRRFKESKGNAKKLFELAKWAESKELPAQARAAFLAVIEAEKDHEGARAALGHVKFDGDWVTREERLKRIRQREDAEAARKAAEAAKKNAPPAPPPLPTPKPPSAPPADPDVPSVPPTVDKGGTGGGSGPEAGPDVAGPKRERTWMDDIEGGVGWDDAYTIETAHYLIKTNVKKDYGKRYAKIMEALADRYTKIFEFAGNDFRYKKNELVLYRCQQEFLDFERQSPGVGGFYEPWSKRIVTFHGPWAGTNGSTLGTLAHEATHQFQNLVLRQMDHAPTFMIEGLATFFEATEVREDGEVIVGKIPMDRLTGLRRGIKSGDYIRLKELIRTPHASFGGYHYAHAWALLHWMQYGPDKAKAKKLLDWYWALCLERPTKAEDFEAGVAKMGYTMEKLEQAWKDWILAMDPAKDPAIAEYEQSKKKKK